MKEKTFYKIKTKTSSWIVLGGKTKLGGKDKYTKSKILSLLSFKCDLDGKAQLGGKGVFIKSLTNVLI